MNETKEIQPLEFEGYDDDRQWVTMKSRDGKYHAFTREVCEMVVEHFKDMPRLQPEGMAPQEQP